MTDDWTEADAREAALEGWGLHQTHGCFGLYPENPGFDAIAYVRERAEAGSALHRKALRLCNL